MRSRPRSPVATGRASRPGAARRHPGASPAADRSPHRVHGDGARRRAGGTRRRTRPRPAARERQGIVERVVARAGDARLPAMRETTAAHRAGYAAIVGRPNVGKSTLLNALVGAKVALATRKQQTTRNQVVGIRTLPGAQIIFIDTPGIHDARSLINRRMVETARQALGEADVVLLVIDAAAGVTPADRALAGTLATVPARTIVALNKMDPVARPDLLPAMAQLGEVLPGRELLPA